MPVKAAVIFSAGILLLLDPGTSAQSGILAILPEHSPVALEAFEGFKAALPAEGITLHRTIASGTAPKELTTVSAIVCFGTPALNALSGWNPHQGRIVYSLVLDPPEMPTWGGVTMRIPAAEKTALIRMVLPSVERLVVAYTGQSMSDFKEIEHAGRNQKMTVSGQPVNNASELLDLLRTTAPQGKECFLMIPDAAIYNKAVIERLMLEALRLRIAVVGLSAAYVRAGALFAPDADVTALGRQTASIAVAALTPGTPQMPAPESPRTIVYSVNTIAAQRCGITLSPQVLNGASAVYGR